MEIIKKDINELKPYKDNANTHSRESIDIIRKSIFEFGFNVPVIIDRESNVICGHGRIIAASEIGMTEVPCIIKEDLTKVQLKAYRIMENKTHEYSQWDFNILKKELDFLNEKEYGLEFTGFSNEEFEKLNGIEIEDHKGEWNGMPEYQNTNLTPIKQIIVSFSSLENRDKFAELIGVKLTDKTKSIFYPPEEKESFKELRY